MSELDIRAFTVGPVQENAHIVLGPPDPADPARRPALMIDPGEEPQRLLDAADALGAKIDAILITHCHFDHIGAVAPVARATGAPVYCPEIEVGVLADIMSWVPWDGFGPFESYDADHTLRGGERLTLAGLRIDVLFTPGHSPGHLTYAISAPGQDAAGGAGLGEAGAAPAADDARADADAPALLSGDVLFQGSVGRTDLPGADFATLQRSLAQLLHRFPDHTVVHPGHMGATTLGRERATNPFLRDLPDAHADPREPVPVSASAPRAAAPAGVPPR